MRRLECLVSVLVLVAVSYSWADQGSLLRPESVIQIKQVRAEPQGDETQIPPNVDQGWFSKVKRDIAKREYFPTPVADSNNESTYQAPNRAHNFRIQFSKNGVQIKTRDGSESWVWGLSLQSWGYRGDEQNANPVDPYVKDNRVEYTRENITEWYVNESRGLEFGYTIDRDPSEESGELVFRVLSTGSLNEDVLPDGSGLNISDNSGKIIVCDSVYAEDASGVPLAAWFESSPGGFSIVVDDTDAIYPIIVDPWITGADWSVDSNQLSAWMGASIDVAGDLNNDGYEDIIIGSDIYDIGGVIDAGAAFVYYGGENGPAVTPDWTGTKGIAGSLYGTSVAGIGDFNGDGFNDIAVGADRYTNTETNEGAVFVYFGSSTGLAATADWAVYGGSYEHFLGRSVAGTGDVDDTSGKGLIVGTADRYGSATFISSAHLFYWTSADQDVTDAVWTKTTTTAGTLLGFNVAGDCDINGDGYSEVLVSEHLYDTDEGRVYLYYGSSNGPDTANEVVFELPAQSNGYFGRYVDCAGDVNGDGYDDVIIGSPEYSGSGAAFLYFGSASGIDTQSDWSFVNGQAGSRFGDRVGGVGDLNNDGFDDIAISSIYLDSGQVDEGSVVVFYGTVNGPQSIIDWRMDSDQDYAYFGAALAGGDVNGDGFDDLLVSAHAYDYGQADEGAVFLYYGSAAGLPWRDEADQVGAQMGVSVAGAGDVNNDGFDDIIVGSSNYDSGQIDEGAAFLYFGSPDGPTLTPVWMGQNNTAYSYYGFSVDGAGDINNDGYDDVIIGAFAMTVTQPNEGAVHVYYGSATGLGSYVAWAQTSSQAHAWMGYSVAGAGDVDGNGYDDIIIGSRLFDGGQVNEGSVTAHYSYGSLSSQISWMIELNHTDAQLGNSVAGAGDVNCDGYDDVIVSAFAYDDGDTNTGLVLVYYGSSGGLLYSPALAVSGTQAHDYFGMSVSGAGDVNGDGCDDVIIGAIGFDNGEIDEGRAFVFHGSSTGISQVPDWTFESDQAGSQLGYSVSGAGDINGDGFDDVIIGAPYYDNTQNDEGRIFIYHGSANGLLPNPDWYAESNKADAFFGGSVSAAGDVNGDGFDDFLVGSRTMDIGQTDEGRVFLYYGINPALYDSDGDGLTDRQEIENFGTDPTKTDTDNDGLSDWAEIYMMGTDPHDDDSDGDGINDGKEDSDSDGLSDGYELSVSNTDPNNPDSDGDGTNDGADLDSYGPNPLTLDTDLDGLPDYYEVTAHQTNPLDGDSDDDGLLDGAEVNTHSTDPLDADSDNDLFSDMVEVRTGSNPNSSISQPYLALEFQYNTRSEVTSGKAVAK